MRVCPPDVSLERGGSSLPVSPVGVPSSVSRLLRDRDPRAVLAVLAEDAGAVVHEFVECEAQELLDGAHGFIPNYRKFPEI